eukprot:9778211-Alexandrium_andersonii.AAC.1
MFISIHWSPAAMRPRWSSEPSSALEGMLSLCPWVHLLRIAAEVQMLTQSAMRFTRVRLGRACPHACHCSL